LWHKKYRNVGLNTRRSEVYWIHTSTGCALNCTYCAEKLAFGRIQSKPIERIVSEFKRGLQEGYGRFCLLSWDLGAYGIDVGCTLSDLLTKLINTDDKRNYKLLLTQINPFYLKQMYSDLEEVFSSGKIEELGCQVESGSNRILGLMGRMYTAEEWMRYMLKIRNKFPKIFLTTHLMVGFPSETNEDFKATMKLLDRIFLDDVIIFKFSKRQQTPASCFPGQIPEKVKESRYRRLALKATLSTTIKKIQRLTNLG
jgi:tRNA A37 methylthiotransferase MiaB